MCEVKAKKNEAYKELITVLQYSLRIGLQAVVVQTLKDHKDAADKPGCLRGTHNSASGSHVYVLGCTSFVISKMLDCRSGIRVERDSNGCND